jgi:pyruvate/2-oxoglutarate dehydrogenase complex dihydrolipoamide dehydrogenase (E3) component
MDDSSFDFVVIGGGSAGYAAASTAARLGLKTAVVEGGDQVGGLCILRGCMPSKALLACSQRAAAVRSAAPFGVEAELKRVDLPRIQARKRTLIEDFASYRQSQLASGRFTFLRARARFVDHHSLLLADLESGVTRPIHARSILIASGSRLHRVPIPGLWETGCLDSDAVLSSETLPRSVLVLGGGAIALEAATYYAGLGSQVTLLQRSKHLLKEMDPDISAALQDGLQAHGIRIETDLQLERVERVGDQKRIHYRQAGQSRSVEADEIVYALGRVPNTESLEISKAGIEQRDGFIATNQHQQTNLPHIFAAGDVCGPFEVVHIAIQQGELAARNAHRLLHGNPTESLESIDYRLKLLAVFSDPGVASVGLTEKEAHARGVPIATASYPFNDHGKSMVEGHLHGLVKLIVQAETREILGGAVVGPEACELIHEIVVAMAFRSTAGALAQIPHYHPTLSEIWTYPAEELAE